MVKKVIIGHFQKIPGKIAWGDMKSPESDKNG